MKKPSALLRGCAVALPAAAETVVVNAAHMIDVVAGRVVDQPQVIITDGRISAVGKRGDAVPDGAQRIDLGERTLLPGLVDMHVHLTSDPTLSAIVAWNTPTISGRWWAWPMRGRPSRPGSPPCATSVPATTTTWR